MRYPRLRTIIHRKNSLFLKTVHGAQVGDAFMRLIYTCQLHMEWMPWNCRDTLRRLQGK